MRKLTLLGRSTLLISSELLANVLCWILAGLLFGRHEETRGLLSLCVLAWTLGLRHALDADHISAIDNATRGLINRGQLPVTCGLYFSLGHSTIVIIVNVAIAISTDVYDKIGSVGTVGAIVGSAVSGSFLFLVGLANSIILWRIMRQRRNETSIQVVQEHATSLPSENLQPGTVEDQVKNSVPQSSLMMRILGPIVRCVDKPWKMYPVGVLFGFGVVQFTYRFDTASSIALLAVSAIAKRDSSGHASIKNGDVIILPLLFTAGMSIVDSADSILMLYSYAGFPESGLALVRPNAAGRVEDVADQEASMPIEEDHGMPVGSTSEQSIRSIRPMIIIPDAKAKETGLDVVLSEDSDQAAFASLRVKQNTMSGLSIVLTLISILVAFSISIITIMGLIGSVCHSCQDAADAPDGGGLAGRWWRAWAKVRLQWRR
ncbi:hypothetical protein FRB96_000902 [Tulasnella sp. 330]|nr:hypothetical protein FRB96_000902 [Tulasnella sp. 330]